MKIASKYTGRIIRLGVLATAMLFGQQVMAEGTRAGTTIENTASVDYTVGTIDQTDVLSNTVSFVVDRRVNLTIVPTSTPDVVTVNPGGDGYFVDFLLASTSNSDLDFNIVLTQETTGTEVDGTGLNDDTDVDDPRIAVFTDFESGTPVAPTDPGAGTTTAVIEDMPADEGIRIRVWGDAALTMTDGQVAGLVVTATALDTTGAALAYGVANDGGLQNFDANGANGVVFANDGFTVEAATLDVAKDATVVDGDLGTGLALPGSRWQYEIVISNSAGSATAEDVVLTDTIDGDLTFLTGGAGGSDFTDIQVDDGTGAVECTAADGDTDGCQVVGGVLTVGDANRVIDIAAGGSYTVRFQVLIPDGAPTPPAP